MFLNRQISPTNFKLILTRFRNLLKTKFLLAINVFHVKPIVCIPFLITERSIKLLTGMLDIALLTANASQLKYILQVGEKHEFYSLMLGLITTSIILQVRYTVIDTIRVTDTDRYNSYLSSKNPQYPFFRSELERISNLIILRVSGNAQPSSRNTNINSGYENNDILQKTEKYDLKMFHCLKRVIN